MRKLRILVVDDDAFVLKTFAKALAKDGAEVATAIDSVLTSAHGQHR